MKANKYIKYTVRLLKEVTSKTWPIWWTVIPFLLLYSVQFSKCSQLFQVIL